jgi:Tol biopolymer transport system component
LVALIALALAACGTATGPSPSATPELPAPSADASTPPSSPSLQPTTPETTPPPPTGDATNGLTLVQFHSSDDPASQVFVIDADGNLRQVTGGSGALPGATGPQWSPDGAWLAFNPPKVGAKVIPDLGVVRADGSEEHVIGQGINPRWSPDGTRVLFQQVEPIEDESLSMFVADLATGEVTIIGEGYDPRWLPDGRVAYDWASLDENGALAQALRVLSLEDGSVVEIAQNMHGTWSPDGSAVLLADDTTIYLADADGSNPRAIANGWAPVWSPDGSRLAIERSYPEPSVLVLDATTGAVLAEFPGALDPTWMP